jgi:hypothetical protein
VASRILCVKCAENLDGVPAYERFDTAELFSGIKPPLAAASAPGANLSAEVQEKARLWDQHQKNAQANRLSAGANVFYWIAGVSLLSTIIFWTGKHINFIDSLGATQTINLFTKGLMQQLTKLAFIPAATAFVLNLLIALLCVWFGVNAHKGRRSFFLIGMALYLMDMLIVIRSLDFLSIAFHGFALYGLYVGLRACLDVRKGEVAV